MQLFVILGVCMKFFHFLQCTVKKSHFCDCFAGCLGPSSCWTDEASKDSCSTPTKTAWTRLAKMTTLTKWQLGDMKLCSKAHGHLWRNTLVIVWNNTIVSSLSLTTAPFLLWTFLVGNFFFVGWDTGLVFFFWYFTIMVICCENSP